MASKFGRCRFLQLGRAAYQNRFLSSQAASSDIETLKAYVNVKRVDGMFLFILFIVVLVFFGDSSIHSACLKLHLLYCLAL